MKHLQFLVLCVVVPVLLQAQLQRQLAFERIEGLSQNTVYAITADKKGFMWIATANGLNRYDGVQIKAYKPGIDYRQGLLRGRVIRSTILEDNKEQLWFSTGISTFSFQKKNEFFAAHALRWHKGKRIGIELYPILATGEDVWFSNHDLGIFRFNESKDITEHFPLPAALAKDYQIYQWGTYDNQNQLWITANLGFFSFNYKTHQWRHFAKEKSFKKPVFCSDSLYLCSGGDVYIYHEKSNRLRLVEMRKPLGNHAASNIECLYADSEENIWAGDATGNIYSKKKASNYFEWRGNINSPDNVNTPYPVYCMYVDANKILWVGADVLGLLRANTIAPQFNTFPRAANNLPDKSLFVHTIYAEASSNLVWLGTYLNGLIIFNKKTGLQEKKISPTLNLPGASQYSVSLLYKDAKDRIWLGYRNTIFIIDQPQNTIREVPLKPGINDTISRIYCITPYNGGWLVGASLGLFQIRENETGFPSEPLAVLAMSNVACIYADPGGKVWLGYENGIIISDKLNEPPQDISLFAGTGIKSFLPDTANQLLWISTTAGLVAYHLPSGAYKLFTEEDGLPDSYVYGALQAGANEIWVSTNNGLSKINFSFPAGASLPSAVFTNFTKSDGLPENEFNSGAFAKGEDGDLFFGTINGVAWFSPAKVTGNNQLPKISMIDLQVNGERADSLLAPEYIKHLHLPYYKNNLYFRFRGIEYNNPLQVEYAYQLQGWDKDWVYSNTLNEVRYNNLTDGQYIFRVKAANGSGKWNDEIYEVNILISPPFWKTNLFYILAATAIVFFIIFITKYIAQRRLRKKILLLEQQREMDKERQRISREMHDDIGAGLTQITLMSESAKLNPMASQKELKDIAGTSRELVNSMSEIIWSLNPAYNSLQELMSYLREQLNRQLEYSDMQCEISLPQHENAFLLTNEQRRNLLMVSKEIVNNAIKYSKASQLWFNVSLQENRLSFDVKDNGIGFCPEANLKGNGLKNIKQRMRELNGNLDIDTKPGNGCRFLYSIVLHLTT